MEIPVTTYPAINATLNGVSALLLVSGRVLIGRRQINAHKRVMIAAFTSSSLFLCTYLYYHLRFHLLTRFTGHGWSRPFYFALLTSHTILAVVVVPLVIVSLRRGLRRDDARHRAIARWTFPIWLYVSVTGVLVYFMLYRWFAPK